MKAFLKWLGIGFMIGLLASVPLALAAKAPRQDLLTACKPERLTLCKDLEAQINATQSKVGIHMKGECNCKCIGTCRGTVAALNQDLRRLRDKFYFNFCPGCLRNRDRSK